MRTKTILGMLMLGIVLISGCEAIELSKYKKMCSEFNPNIEEYRFARYVQITDYEEIRVYDACIFCPIGIDEMGNKGYCYDDEIIVEVQF